MFAAQNTHLQSDPSILMSNKLLKFCYIIMPLFLYNCGDSKTEQKATQTVVETTTESKKTSNTPKTILCFGDSITAGYGLEDNQDAYPGILQKRIDSLNLNFQVINSGVSGETTAGGKSRIDWILNQPIDIFLLELGANDGLRGVPVSETKSNLQEIINLVQEKQPQTKIILAGMELPPNLGETYTKDFRNLFADLAQKNNLAFIPFILKEVGGDPTLNQGDGIHPNLKGHKVVANTVWEILYPLMKS